MIFVPVETHHHCPRHLVGEPSIFLRNYWQAQLTKSLTLALEYELTEEDPIYKRSQMAVWVSERSNEVEPWVEVVGIQPVWFNGEDAVVYRVGFRFANMALALVFKLTFGGLPCSA